MGQQASKHAANERAGAAAAGAAARGISFSIIRRNRRKEEEGKDGERERGREGERERGRQEKRIECALCGGRTLDAMGGREGGMGRALAGELRGNQNNPF